MRLTWGSRPWKVWRSHWNNRGTFRGRRITYAILVALTMLAAIPYTTINRIAAMRGWVAFDPSIQFDFDIPFLAWMVIPYLTLYFYYPAAAYLGSKDDIMWRQNIIFHQMMIISCWIAFLTFLLLPVEIDLRHLIVGVEGTRWEPWYDFLHGADKPWNAWPSLHIVQSTQVMLILRYWYPSSTLKRQVLHGFLLIMWLLLVLSTMVIKQHYVWDVVTALLLTGLGWIYWMKPSLEELKMDGKCQEFDEILNSE